MMGTGTLTGPWVATRSDRMRDHHRVLDADSHVMEPGGLFGDAAPPGRSVLDLAATPDRAVMYRAGGHR